MKWIILSAVAFIVALGFSHLHSNNSPEQIQKPSELIAQACKAQYVTQEEIQSCKIREALRVLGAREQAKQDAVDNQVGTP